jgi:hypothetical protein
VALSMRVRQHYRRHRKQLEARQDKRLRRVLESWQQRSTIATALMGTKPTPAAALGSFASASCENFSRRCE